MKADENLVDSNPMNLVEAYFYYQDTGVHPMIYDIYHEDVSVGFIMAFTALMMKILRMMASLVTIFGA